MPKLNVKYEVASHPKAEAALKLILTPEDRKVFVDLLQAAMDGREVLCDLPEVEGKRWAFYIRAREEGNRVIMARPEENLWVGTLLFPRSVFEEWIQKLNAGEGFSSADFGRLDRVSNFHFSVS